MSASCLSRSPRPTPGWGYTRIRDALRIGLKVEIGRGTVADILADAGIEPAPEREKKRTWKQFVKTIKYECLNQLIFFGEQHLRYVVKEFMAHYLGERFRQGLGGQLIRKGSSSPNDRGANGKVVCRSRLGGMLNYYQREAA